VLKKTIKIKLRKLVRILKQIGDKRLITYTIFKAQFKNIQIAA